MAKDEYFSFGDEDLGGEFDAADPVEGHLSGSAAVALADPPEEEVLGGVGDISSAAERAARPRGDSERASSERLGPAPRRTHLLVAAALVILALVVVRVTITALDGAGTAAPRQDVAAGSQSAPEAIAHSAPQSSAAEQLRASRERAAERQQVRQRRAKTRRRARRSRERRAAQRERRAEKQREQAAAQEVGGAAEPNPSEYIPPAPEAAPEAEPSPPPSDETGMQDGASSPEFGL
jgi:hypothetical protein